MFRDVFKRVKRPNCLWWKHVAKDGINSDFEFCMADGDVVDDELFGLHQYLMNGPSITNY